MKDYQEYMDDVTVSEQLHARIMTGLRQRTVRGRALPFGRYAAVCACATLALVVVWVSFLSGPSGYVSDEALVFNQAKYAPALASKRHIPGYFQEKLSPELAQKLLGDAWEFITEGYTIEAIAGFSGDGALDGVIVTGNSKGEQQIRVLIAGDALTSDRLLFTQEPMLSEGFGPTVTAGHWSDPSDAAKDVYFAAFNLDGTDFYLEISAHQNADEELTKLVNKLVATSDADLSYISPSHIPQWREDELTLAQSQNDPDFGSYVPVNSLPGYVFESAMRVVGQSQDVLRVNYSSGMKYASLLVSRLSAEDMARIVDPSEPQTYDLRLYPIPRASTVPTELRQIVDNPIFRLEDLTLALVEARAYTVNDAGDENSGYRMSFSVLYDDVLVRLDVKGAQPEDVVKMLKGLGR